MTCVGVKGQGLMFLSLCFYQQDYAQHSSVGIVFTHGLIFRPARVTHCTNQGEIGMEQWTMVYVGVEIEGPAEKGSDIYTFGHCCSGIPVSQLPFHVS